MPKNRTDKQSTTMLKLAPRERPEPYSCTIAVRLRPSEKETVKEYASKNNVTVDTVLRSALVAAGVLAA